MSKVQQQYCAICGETAGVRMCVSCQRSYDRWAHNDGSVWEAMAWAANRARRFERDRARLRE